MAAVDPIVYARLCKLFPTLTVKQAINSCYYSLGANYAEASLLQDVSSTAVRRSLELTQKNLGANSMPGIKPVFWSGFILRLTCNKYSLHKANSANSFSCLSSIFKELNLSELSCAVLLSGGRSKELISLTLNISLDAVNKIIDVALQKMKVDSEFLLSILVISRLMDDLS